MEVVREGMGAKVCWTLEERVVLPTRRRHHDKCECAEDGVRASQGALHREKHKDPELGTDAKENPRDHENTTVR